MTAVRANLTGGLGNQMFIAAAAAELASRLSVPFRLRTVTASTLHHGRVSALDMFPTLAANVEHQPHLQFPLALQRRLDRFLPQVFSESSFNYDVRFDDLVRPVRLSGYFQSPKYFPGLDVQDFFRITQQNTRLLEIEATVGTKFRALHVRLGDYNSNKAVRYHGLCSERYFMDAAAHLSREGLDYPTVIFTDQPAQLPRALRDLAVLVLGPDSRIHEALELHAMAHAAALVMSNSSFSWWAAFLGERFDRPVIAPRPWLRQGDIAGSDLLLPHWITFGAR